VIQGNCKYGRRSDLNAIHYQTMKKIKKGDTVIVIAGKHKGKIAVVDKAMGDSLWLHGVNVVKKAVKGQ